MEEKQEVKSLFMRKKEKGFTLIELMVVIVIIGILIGVALPNFMGAQDKAKLSSVKANMHAVQLGVEQYAGDNYGNYPDGVQATGFAWGTYVPSAPKNPFNQSISSSTSMEADVGTAGSSGGPVYTIAQTYTSVTSTAAGNMRYFADTGNKSTYALIGYDKDKKAIRETTGGNAYVLHN